MLVVDDDADSAEAVRLLAGAWGHDAWSANDADAALATARERRPDVVLLDLELGEISGSEVATRLRNLPDVSRAILVAMTGHDVETLRDRFDASRFDHHVAKPVEPAALRDLLASLR